MILLAVLLGLILMLGCGYGVWWVIGTILAGIVTANWLMVIGGGIIAYLCLGILVIGFGAGLYVFLAGLFE